MIPITKIKKLAQGHAGRGWNQHIDKFTRRYANKVVRRIVRRTD